ncbi:MAG: DUF1318 domain-containing protein [Elusimicrobiota bacterium]|nr:DUF1318 domain-containing protein [Elusimicrobiota bacterium]
MNHEEAQEAYSRSLDGTLEPQLHEEMSAHLAGCDACKEFCKGLNQSVNALWELPGAPPVPSGLLARVADKIAATPQPAPSRWNWGISVLALASVTCVVIGGYFAVYRNLPPGLPPIAGPAADGQNKVPSFKSAATIKLPATAIKDIRAAVKDILKIEQALYAVASVKPGLVFRGSGMREDSALVRALSGGQLKDIELTAEIKKALNARHARLEAVEALKTAARIGEDYNGLLSALPGAGALSGSENNTVDAENRDREDLIKLYSAQLGLKLGKAEDIIKPEIVREFSSASRKLTAEGRWYQSKDGKWQQVR